MKSRSLILVYVVMFSCAPLIGCLGSIEAKPRNSDLFYRGYSAAAMAFATMPGITPEIIRPTPRESETKVKSAPVEEADESPAPIADPPEDSATPPPAPEQPTPISEPAESKEPESPVEPPEIEPPTPASMTSKFVPREAPPEAKRQLWYFGGGSWCGPCRVTKPEVELFARSRSLVARSNDQEGADKADVVFYDITPYGQLSGSMKAPPIQIGTVPCIVLVDGTGKELSRLEGGTNFKAIEDLWLGGPKREHSLNGMPVDVPRFQGNVQTAGLDLDWGKLLGTAKLTTTRAEDVTIPIPELGELIIPKSVSITASPWEGGTRVAVDKGTPCPYVKSRWLGNLYPVPILAVSVSPTRAIVELRGWKDVEINLAGPP